MIAALIVFITANEKKGIWLKQYQNEIKTRQRQESATVRDEIPRKIDAQKNKPEQDIEKTGTRALKLATKWKTTYLLGCWLSILSGAGLHLFLSMKCSLITGAVI